MERIPIEIDLLLFTLITVKKLKKMIVCSVLPISIFRSDIAPQSVPVIC